MVKKTRSSLPVDVAARVLFLSDRTCCVCRVRGKPVQIHHIDEDPSNHTLSNLSVLCFDCHRETQIRGGFDRKLDGDQVILYRNDWHAQVSRNRVIEGAERLVDDVNPSESLEIATALAEIYRENGELELLAYHYDRIGNKELRDKYIELVLASGADDFSVIELRSLQQRLDLVPPDVIARELQRYTEDDDLLQRARFYHTLGKNVEAAKDYMTGILKSLDEGNVFSAAYYLKELSRSNIWKELFLIALRHHEEEKSLWWQVRVLQELNWEKELNALLLDHEEEIVKSGDPMLEILLARTKGDRPRAVELAKEIAQSERLVGGGIIGFSRDTATEEDDD